MKFSTGFDGLWTAAERVIEDADTIAVASQLLEDMEAGLRFHRRLIEGPRSDQKGSPADEAEGEAV